MYFNSCTNDLVRQGEGSRLRDLRVLRPFVVECHTGVWCTRRGSANRIAPMEDRSNAIGDRRLATRVELLVDRAEIFAIDMGVDLRGGEIRVS